MTSHPASKHAFFLLFVMESLVSSHLAPLSGPLSHCCIYYSDALRHANLCVLNDQDGADVLQLDMLLINDRTAPSSPRVITRKDAIKFSS